MPSQGVCAAESDHGGLQPQARDGASESGVVSTRGGYLAVVTIPI